MYFPIFSLPLLLPIRERNLGKDTLARSSLEGRGARGRESAVVPPPTLPGSKLGVAGGGKEKSLGGGVCRTA